MIFIRQNVSKIALNILYLGSNTVINVVVLTMMPNFESNKSILLFMY